VNQRYRELLRKLRKNDQRGFTLIELLVVISILGILAAVVTMSMVGVTQLAQHRAADAEKQTVQLAMDTMANEQQVPVGQICPSPAPASTQDMTAFPSSTSSGSLPDPNTPTGKSVSLYPRYLRQQKTYGEYYCDPDGTVHQTGYSPP